MNAQTQQFVQSTMIEADNGQKQALYEMATALMGTIEEVYEKDPDLLHADNYADYCRAVEILGNLGFGSPGGKMEIIQQSNYFTRPNNYGVFNNHMVKTGQQSII